MKTTMTALAAVLTLAVSASVANAAKGGAGFDINKDGPRIERGERINWEPKVIEREPSPIERVIDAVIDSPVRPAMDRDGNWGMQFNKSFP